MSDKASLLIDRARALAPLLAEHAEEAERLRRPHDVVMKALEESEIFKLMVPRKLGGFELDLDTFLEVGLALGEGDASMAWVATFYIEHCWLLCHFPQAFHERVLGQHGYVLTPAAIAPSGAAIPVEGGYRLSGRWQWGTGAMHADWVMVGGSVTHADNRLDMRFFAMPVADVTIEDTWFVDGMLGTGSNDIVVTDLMVAEEQTVSLFELAEGKGLGSKLYAGPLYRTPMIPVLGLAAAMPAVAQAKAAVQRFRDHMSERILYLTTTKQSDKPAAQMRLARAELEARQAELLLRDVVEEAMELRDLATPADRSRWVAAYAFAVDQSKRVVQSVAEASGAHAHFKTHPLQRAVRDLNTMSSHVIFDLDSRLENYGRTMLGLDPQGLF